MMLLSDGQWQGSGSWLEDGTTQNLPIRGSITVATTEVDQQLEGALGPRDGGGHTLRLRLVPNEVGTYTLEAFWGRYALHGTGKFDSAPNMGMLWSDDRSIHAAFSLFVIDGGIGCRGFLRRDSSGATWEMALRPAARPRAANVVTLRRR